MELELLPLWIPVHPRLTMDKLIEQIAALTEAMHRYADATYALAEVLIGAHNELEEEESKPAIDLRTMDP